MLHASNLTDGVDAGPLDIINAECVFMGFQGCIGSSAFIESSII